MNLCFNTDFSVENELFAEKLSLEFCKSSQSRSRIYFWLYLKEKSASAVVLRQFPLCTLMHIMTFGLLK